MNFVEILTWLASGGGAAIALSWAFERWAWFQAQTPKVKEAIYNVATSVVVALAGLVLFYTPADWLVYLNPIFAALYAIVGALIVGQKFHMFDKKTK